MSYLPLAVVAGTFVLALGCGGDDSVASQSARAFREAQQRGETFGGDGQAHGHGPTSAGHDSTTTGSDHAPTQAEEHDSPMNHAAMGHGGVDQGAQAGEAMDHSAMGDIGAQRSGQTMNHAAMGHGNPPAGAAPLPVQPTDHAAMGHGTPAETERSTRGPLQAGSVVALAAPVLPGAPAATLASDALDAPAPTSVLDAQRSAAMASAMSGGGGHGGHGGTGTYRQVDAGRDSGAADASRDDKPGAGDPGHEGHGAGTTASSSGRDARAGGTVQEEEVSKVVYICPMHSHVRSEEPGACPICGMALKRREE